MSEPKRPMRHTSSLNGITRDRVTYYIQREADAYMDHLEAELTQLRTKVERFSKRDGNATIELTYNDGEHPFARETLAVVDFGVADNGYVVESKLIAQLRAERDRMREALESAVWMIEHRGMPRLGVMKSALNQREGGEDE